MSLMYSGVVSRSKLLQVVIIVALTDTTALASVRIINGVKGSAVACMTGESSALRGATFVIPSSSYRYVSHSGEEECCQCRRREAVEHEVRMGLVQVEQKGAAEAVVSTD